MKRTIVLVLLVLITFLVACKTEVQKINEQIQNLPSVEEITLEYETTIIELLEQVYNLDNEAFNKIIVENLDKLHALEEKIILLRFIYEKQALLDEFIDSFGLLPSLEELDINSYDNLQSINALWQSFDEDEKELFEEDYLQLLEEYNQKMESTLIPEQILAEEAAIAELINSLEEAIPSEAEEDITLPRTYKSLVADFSLVWHSPSPSVLSSLGLVSRQEYDTVLSLSVTISSLFTEVKHDFTIKIKGTNNPDLPSLNTEKKLTFAYLRTSGVGTNLLERDYMKIDVINYAFGKIVNGELSILGLSNLDKVLSLRAKGVRVVIVIDGVETNTRADFVTAASTAENREKLANSIVRVIQQYQFDGVDLDWEYPSGTVEKNNFSLLLKLIREKLDATGRDLILSIAVVASSYATHYDLPEIDKYIDYLHIMTYGMNNKEEARHQSALIKSRYATYSIASSVNMYINGGISRDKVVFGIPFYVRMGTLAKPNASALGLSLN